MHPDSRPTTMGVLSRMPACFRGAIWFCLYVLIAPQVSWAWEKTTYPGLGNTAFGFNFSMLGHLPEIAQCRSLPAGRSGKLVILIHDLHCQGETQRHIANLLEILARRAGIRRVGVEGESGPVDVEPLATLPGNELRKMVADYFLDRGYLSGPEYSAALNRGGVKLVGVEDAALYHASEAALRELLSAESTGLAQDFLDSLLALKARMFRGDLARWDQLAEEFAERRIPAPRHWARLRQWLAKSGAAPDFSGAMADTLEKKILCADEQLRERLYFSADQRELDHWVRLARVIQHLVNISATQEDIAYVNAHAGEFQVRTLAVYFERHGSDLESGEVPTPDAESLGRLGQMIEKARCFYRLAEERSERLAKNLLRWMEAEKEERAALVVGGFHAAQVEETLRKFGVGFYSLQPRLDHPEAFNPYYAILQNRRTPLEKLLGRGNGYFKPRAFFYDPIHARVMDLVAQIGYLGKNLNRGGDFADSFRQWRRSWPAADPTIHLEPDTLITHPEFSGLAAIAARDDKTRETFGVVVRPAGIFPGAITRIQSEKISSDQAFDILPPSQSSSGPLRRVFQDIQGSFFWDTWKQRMIRVMSLSLGSLTLLGIGAFWNAAQAAIVTYQVAPGDTLGDIAEKIAGGYSKYRDIARSNHIRNPNLIHPGQEVTFEANPDTMQTGLPRARGSIRMEAEQGETEPAGAGGGLDSSQQGVGTADIPHPSSVDSVGVAAANPQGPFLPDSGPGAPGVPAPGPSLPDSGSGLQSSPAPAESPAAEILQDWATSVFHGILAIPLEYWLLGFAVLGLVAWLYWAFLKSGRDAGKKNGSAAELIRHWAKQIRPAMNSLPGRMMMLVLAMALPFLFGSGFTWSWVLRSLWTATGVLFLFRPAAPVRKLVSRKLQGGQAWLATLVFATLGFWFLQIHAHLAWLAFFYALSHLAKAAWLHRQIIRQTGWKAWLAGKTASDTANPPESSPRPFYFLTYEKFGMEAGEKIINFLLQLSLPLTRRILSQYSLEDYAEAAKQALKEGKAVPIGYWVSHGLLARYLAHFLELGLYPSAVVKAGYLSSSFGWIWALLYQAAVFAMIIVILPGEAWFFWPAFLVFAILPVMNFIYIKENDSSAKNAFDLTDALWSGPNKILTFLPMSNWMKFAWEAVKGTFKLYARFRESSGRPWKERLKWKDAYGTGMLKFFGPFFMILFFHWLGLEEMVYPFSIAWAVGSGGYVLFDSFLRTTYFFSLFPTFLLKSYIQRQIRRSRIQTLRQEWEKKQEKLLPLRTQEELDSFIEPLYEALQAHYLEHSPAQFQKLFETKPRFGFMTETELALGAVFTQMGKLDKQGNIFINPNILFLSADSQKAIIHYLLQRRAGGSYYHATLAEYKNLITGLLGRIWMVLRWPNRQLTHLLIAASLAGIVSGPIGWFLGLESNVFLFLTVVCVMILGLLLHHRFDHPLLNRIVALDGVDALQKHRLAVVLAREMGFHYINIKHLRSALVWALCRKLSNIPDLAKPLNSNGLHDPHFEEWIAELLEQHQVHSVLDTVRGEMSLTVVNLKNSWDQFTLRPERDLAGPDLQGVVEMMMDDQRFGPLLEAAVERSVLAMLGQHANHVLVDRGRTNVYQRFRPYARKIQQFYVTGDAPSPRTAGLLETDPGAVILDMNHLSVAEAVHTIQHQLGNGKNHPLRVAAKFLGKQESSAVKPGPWLVEFNLPAGPDLEIAYGREIAQALLQDYFQQLSRQLNGLGVVVTQNGYRLRALAKAGVAEGRFENMAQTALGNLRAQYRIFSLEAGSVKKISLPRLKKAIERLNLQYGEPGMIRFFKDALYGPQLLVKAENTAVAEWSEVIRRADKKNQALPMGKVLQRYLEMNLGIRLLPPNAEPDSESSGLENGGDVNAARPMLPGVLCRARRLAPGEVNPRSNERLAKWLWDEWENVAQAGAAAPERPSEAAGRDFFAPELQRTLEKKVSEFSRHRLFHDEHGLPHFDRRIPWVYTPAGLIHLLRIRLPRLLVQPESRPDILVSTAEAGPGGKPEKKILRLVVADKNLTRMLEVEWTRGPGTDFTDSEHDAIQTALAYWFSLKENYDRLAGRDWQTGVPELLAHLELLLSENLFLPGGSAVRLNAYAGNQETVELAGNYKFHTLLSRIQVARLSGPGTDPSASKISEYHKDLREPARKRMAVWRDQALLRLQHSSPPMGKEPTIPAGDTAPKRTGLVFVASLVFFMLPALAQGAVLGSGLGNWDLVLNHLGIALAALFFARYLLKYGYRSSLELETSPEEGLPSSGSNGGIVQYFEQQVRLEKHRAPGSSGMTWRNRFVEAWRFRRVTLPVSADEHLRVWLPNWLLASPMHLSRLQFALDSFPSAWLQPWRRETAKRTERGALTFARCL